MKARHIHVRMRILAAFVLVSTLGRGVIVDRIAAVIGKRVITDSDIVQDLRITAFLNNQQPSFLPAARKKAADRLIDQMLIRSEVEEGDYPTASLAEAKNFLASIKKSRFATETAYTKALASYVITDGDVLERLSWQLTALRFIDVRFRPAVNPTDAESQQYYNEHRLELITQNPGKTTFGQLQGAAQDAVVNQQVDKALDDWLKQRRTESSIVYYEEELK